jgi:hypothetical protein
MNGGKKENLRTGSDETSGNRVLTGRDYRTDPSSLGGGLEARRTATCTGTSDNGKILGSKTHRLVRHEIQGARATKRNRAAAMQSCNEGPIQ